MSIGIAVSGVDLDSLCQPIGATSKRADVGLRYQGVDISNRYMRTSTPNLPVASVAPYGIKSSGVDISTLFQPLGWAPGATLRVSITSGSGTWYASSLDAAVGYRVKCVIARVCGGGGSGGTGPTTSSAGGGGGGFQYGYVDVSSGAVSYSVGAGGAVPGSAGPGNAGGTTSFGSLSATGGEGAVGYRAAGGYGGTPNGGNGGTAYTGAHTGSASTAASFTPYTGSLTTPSAVGGGTAAGNSGGGGGSIGRGGDGGSTVGPDAGSDGTAPGGGGGGGNTLAYTYAGARGQIDLYY